MQLSQYTTRDRLLATQCPPDNWGRIVRLGYTLLATRMVGHAYVNVNRPTSHVTSPFFYRRKRLPKKDTTSKEINMAYPVNNPAACVILDSLLHKIVQFCRALDLSSRPRVSRRGRLDCRWR